MALEIVNLHEIKRKKELENYYLGVLQGCIYEYDHVLNPDDVDEILDLLRKLESKRQKGIKWVTEN